MKLLQDFDVYGYSAIRYCVDLMNTLICIVKHVFFIIGTDFIHFGNMKVPN